MTLGQRIALLREATGLSARGFDRLIGAPEGHTSLIEADNFTTMATKTAAKIRAKLPVSTDWLLYGEGSPPKESAVRAALRAIAAKGAA